MAVHQQIAGKGALRTLSALLSFPSTDEAWRWFRVLLSVSLVFVRVTDLPEWLNVWIELAASRLAEHRPDQYG
jgi:hypothetical protein